MKLILLSLSLLVAGTVVVRAQDTAGSRALTMDEYEKAKTFSVGDPDKDTYIKFENAYILDHSGFGKPYFITGDDGKKKRIDLYKLILKDGRVELGTVIYYTTESGKRYTAVMPGYKADPKVWRKYFEDIHAMDKEEPFFVLKLSYVLSEELGYQLYRSASGVQGGAVSREAGTYGNDICFPGDMQVTLAGGVVRRLSEVKTGDEIVTVDPATRQAVAVTVKQLTVHEAKNYAITKVLLLSVTQNRLAGDAGPDERDVLLHSKWLEATPNHPMVTLEGRKKAGELKEGDKLECRDEQTGSVITYTVWYRSEAPGGVQRVYNIVAEGGTTLVINGVVVSQK